MKFTSAENIFFDDRETHAMGAAFDKALASLTRLASNDTVRELIARRIVEAAKTGPRDQPRLLSRALVGFFTDDELMPDVSTVPEIPDPAYALIPRVA